MNEEKKPQKEKTYWDRWVEESCKGVYVFDGTNYWTTRTRGKHKKDGIVIFDMETKLEEVEYENRFGGNSSLYVINDKWYKEVSNG